MKDDDKKIQSESFDAFCVLCICVGEATKKNGKKFHTLCELSQKMENPPSLYFTTISATFWAWKSMFFAIIKSLWMREMTKSLSKISLKSSSKQTDYEKFSSLWTKIWYCGGDVLHGRIFEFSIRSEICRSRIRMRRLVPRRPILRRAPTSTHAKRHQPVSHIILNGSMHKWNPASGILNELSDCIL